MTATITRRSWKLFTAAGLSLAAIGTLSACRAVETPNATAAAVTQAPAGQPMLISCAPGQQPLVSQVVVNGTWVPQAECVTVGATPQGVAASAQAQAWAPQGYAAAAAPAPVYSPAPVYTPAPVYAPAPTPVAVERPVRRQPTARRVVYDDDVIEYESPRKNRSWQKSAIIIGSSAGVGAGVGAATGGKKGALLGAAIGGGAATIWDQATRRK